MTLEYVEDINMSKKKNIKQSYEDTEDTRVQSVAPTPLKEKSKEEEIIEKLKKELGDKPRTGGGSFVLYAGMRVPREMYNKIVLNKDEV